MGKKLLLMLLLLNSLSPFLHASSLNPIGCLLRLANRGVSPMERQTHDLPYADVDSWYYYFTGRLGFHFPGQAEPVGNYVEVLYQPDEGLTTYVKGVIIHTYPMGMDVWDVNTNRKVSINVGLGDVINIAVRPTVLTWYLRVLGAHELYYQDRAAVTHGTWIGVTWTRQYLKNVGSWEETLPTIGVLCPVWEHGELTWEHLDEKGRVTPLPPKDVKRNILYTKLNPATENELLEFWNVSPATIENLKHACDRRHRQLTHH